MKKTLIALAAVASFGASYAQVAITGGVDFTYGKSTSGTKGLAATDAYIDIGVTEDLGGGLKAIAAMEFNADGSSWSTVSGQTTLSSNDTMYGGDKSLTFTGASFGTLVLTNTRSGGILNNIMFAPEVSSTDHWSKANAGVMQRSNVDAVAYLLPAMGPVTVGYKYVEGGDSYGTPLNVTHVLYGKYAQGPLTAVVEYNIRQPEYITANGGDARSQRLDATVTYDAGVAKVALGFETAGLNTANNTTSGTAATATLLSALVPVGNNSIGVNWGKRDAASFTEFAGQYNLSKTTYVAASFGTIVDQSSVSNDTFGIRIGKNF